jgi:transketolase
VLSDKKLKDISKLVRYEIIKQTCHKKSGHLGGALSCTDILVNIFNNYLFSDGDNKFVLSKGHCALAVYSVLYEAKKLSKKKFESFSNQGSFYGEHPSPKINNKYLIFSTGSLGHGTSFGSGMAYSKKIKNNKGNIFVLVSDGEMNSGTVWEAALLSSKLNLNNLIVIVDYNKFQATGKSDEILNIKPLNKKWKSFGWDVIECNGNSHVSINSSFKSILKNKSKPKIIIAHTIKGKGVNFMENDNNWHYRSPSKNELKQAKIQLKIK